MVVPRRRQREEHKDLFNRICSLETLRSSNVGSDGNEQHEAWLARLKELTAEIVDLDRDRSGGRHGEFTSELVNLDGEIFGGRYDDPLTSDEGSEDNRDSDSNESISEREDNEFSDESSDDSDKKSEEDETSEDDSTYW